MTQKNSMLVLLIAVVAIAASAFCASAADLVLSPGDFEIVADTSDAGDPKFGGTAFAAKELKDLLGEAFGAEIPVVVKATGTKKTLALLVDPSFERDQIRIVVRKDGADIVTGKGKTCGVYEFLERFAGMRFYFPGPLGTIVPRRSELKVPCGTVDVKPDYTQRSCDMNWGLNGRWYSLKGDGYAEPEEVTNLLRLARARMRLAPRLMCCHGLNKFRYLERFGKTNPEYFALMKGVDGSVFRDDANSKWTGHRGQLCHTSGIWEKEIYADAVRAIAADGYVDVMAQDGMRKCLCERCMAAYSKDPDDPQYATELIWGNTVRLANRLSAAGIPGVVTQMAYHPYGNIPSVEIPSNVMVMVAKTGPWAAGVPGKLDQDNAEIRAWARKCGHRVWIWNYAGKFCKKQKNVDIPQMTPRAIARYYSSLSDAIFGSYLESRTDRWIYNYLNYYVYNKVSWNVKTDVEALLAEHDRLMFGAAASEIRAYYDRLEDFWIHRISGNIVETDLGPVVREPTEYQKWVDIFTPAVIAEFDGYLSRAAAKVPPASMEARRIAFIRKNFYDPMKAASDKYLDKVDAARNEIARAGRENRSILKGTRFDAPEEIELDGAEPRFKTRKQSIAGLLKPDTEYIVSFFMRHTNVVAKAHNGGAGVFVTDGKKGCLFPTPAERTGSRGWMYYETKYRTSPEPGKNSFVQLGVSGAVGKAWFKGLRIEEAK